MIIRRIYQALFQLVVPDASAHSKAFLASVHTHLLTVLVTAALMWAYALLALWEIAHPLPGAVGIVASTAHLASPFVYRVTRSTLIAVSLLATTGLVHMTAFSYFTGGFDSNILIWLGILPFVAAIISGRRAAGLWFVVSMLTTSIFLGLALADHPFPQLISARGDFLGHVFITFGWIFLSSALSYTFLVHQERLIDALTAKRAHIENLFRVLFHDLGQPLSLIQLGTGKLARTDDPAEHARGLTLVQAALQSMEEITENARQLYLMQEGRVQLECRFETLAVLIDRAELLYHAQFARKRIRLETRVGDAQVWVHANAFVHQVLGNILSNCLKFSPPETTLTITAAPAGANRVLVTITDQGVGMSEEVIRALLTNTVKTSTVGTAGEKGSGYGLVLMKAFLEKCQGRLEISSSPAGTVFKLNLEGSIP